MIAPSDIGRGCLCLQSRMAARAVTRAYDLALKPLGLRTTQFSLLVAVAHGGARSMTDLAEALALERSTMVRNIDLLVLEGLVSRTHHGRTATLDLTAAGRARLDQAIPLWAGAQAQLSERIGDADGIRAALRRLRKGAQPARRVRAGSANG